ncbi:MAG: arsenite methyltransferase [Actinomycetota bacterium]|nr:arsenite methyltransferase [Actinomycetota bacterium]
MSDVREEVRARYAEAAVSASRGSKDAAALEDCCGPECCGDTISFGSKLYAGTDLEKVPDTALLASLGCGNPTAVAELHEGETVLDLGSGGGIDVLLSARRVGPTGKAFGLDMTDEMLALAEKNKVDAGIDNVEFLKGFIEAIPLPDAAVDVIISNCVINLASDKPAVFTEMHRVLRNGGRIGISDVVSSNDLTTEQRAERGSYVGCIAGALSFAEYEAELARAGFHEISVSGTHEVGDGMWAATIKAIKPVP